MTDGRPGRRQLRLPEYDYSQAGCYFITVCTAGRRCLLGAVGRDDLGAPSVRLTPYGKIVEQYICSIPAAYDTVQIDQYVIMPNHIHLLLWIRTGSGAPGSSRPTQMVPRIVAALKRFTNRDAGIKLWQPSFYDHIIRDENDFLRIWTYIAANPSKWAEDRYYDKEGAAL